MVATPKVFHQNSSMRTWYWICFGGVLYGSLFPFNFVVPVIGEIDVDEFFSVNSVSDTLSNILLFIPVGVFAHLAGRQRPGPFPTLVILAAVLAIAAQLFQVFVPERYPGLLDIVMNLFGLALGTRYGSNIAALARRFSFLRIDLPTPVIFLASAFFVYQLFPFVPTISFTFFKRNLWAMLRANESVDWYTMISLGVAWFVFFTLVIPAIADRRVRGLVLVAPLAVFGARLLIVSNIATLWQLSGGVIGVGAWVLLGKTPAVRLLAVAMIIGVIVWEGLVPVHLIPAADPRTILLAIVWETYLCGSLLFLVWLGNPSRWLHYYGK